MRSGYFSSSARRKPSTAISPSRATCSSSWGGSSRPTGSRTASSIAYGAGISSALRAPVTRTMMTISAGAFLGLRHREASRLPAPPTRLSRSAQALGLPLAPGAAWDASLRRLVPASGDRARAERPDSLTPVAHEDIPLRSSGRSRLHGTRPARPRSAPIPSRSSLAGGEDATSPLDCARGSGARVGARPPGGHPVRPCWPNRVRVGLGTSANARILPRLARCAPTPGAPRLARIRGQATARS
jgi:hypothetical protein